MSQHSIPYKKWVQRTLIDQINFYSDLTTPLNDAKMSMKLGKSDVSMQTTDLSNGDVKVSITIPLDNNRDANDGRLFVKDEFVLEGQGHTVKGFQRTFSYNGRGKSKSWWESQKSKLQGTYRPTGTSQQEFTDKLFNKYFVTTQLFGAGKSGQTFLAAIGTTAQSVYDQFTVKVPAAGSYSSIQKIGNKYLVKFHWVIDDDNKTDNGAVVVEDYFTVDGSSKKLTSHLRRWLVHPDSQGDKESGRRVGLLTRTKKPSKDEAQKFLDAVLPALFSSQKSPSLAKSSAGKTEAKFPPLSTFPKVPVEGPRVTYRKTDDEKKGDSWAWTFSNHSEKLKANADKDNLSRIVVGGTLKPYIQKNIQDGVRKLTFTIKVHFDRKTGFVQKVEFLNVETKGSRINKTALKNMFLGISRKIHERVRVKKNHPDAWWGQPLSFVFA